MRKRKGPDGPEAPVDTDRPRPDDGTRTDDSRAASLWTQHDASILIGSSRGADEFTITFESAISDLSLHLAGWRSPTKAGYSSYTVSGDFTVNDAFDGTVSGSQIATESDFTNGIPLFSGPITTITVTHAYDEGAIHESSQSMTLAQRTAGPVVPGIGGVAALAGIATLGRRRRR